jgi:hypothetical protein
MLECQYMEFHFSDLYYLQYLFLNKGFHNKSLLLVKFDIDQLLHFQIH